MVLAASTVTVAAKKVKLTPSELDLTTQDGSKELECFCDGKICGNGVRWYKDGQELEENRKIMNMGDKLLFMSNDDQNAVGEYRCEVGGTFSDAANVRFSCEYDFFL